MEAKQAKHPYLKVLESQLTTANRKKELLENRIKFLEKAAYPIDTYTGNENQIIIINTNSEISALSRIIKEKETYFINFMQKFIEDCDEMESNFDRVKKEAYEKAETDPAIKDFLGRIFWDNLENNIEAKVGFYKLIKQKL